MNDMANEVVGSGRRLIFVGGPPRSGTTLLQHVLDTHSSVTGTPELLHLPDLIRVHSQFLDSFDSGLLDYFCDRSDLEKATREFIDRLLGPVLSENPTRYVSEKTPANALVFPELSELFPEARFIFVLRDPRATISSMLRVGEQAAALNEGCPAFATNVRESIATVRRYLRKGFDFAQSRAEDCLIVRFEELVREPEAETQRLCEFLKLDWEPRMARPQNKEHAGEAELSQTGVWYDAETINRRPDPSRADGWKNELNPSQQLLITRAFRSFPELVDRGYDLRMDHLSLRNRVIAGAGWAVGASGARIRKLLR